jgi:hypothetical protein
MSWKMGKHGADAFHASQIRRFAPQQKGNSMKMFQPFAATCALAFAALGLAASPAMAAISCQSCLNAQPATYSDENCTPLPGAPQGGMVYFAGMFDSPWFYAGRCNTQADQIQTLANSTTYCGQYQSYLPPGSVPCIVSATFSNGQCDTSQPQFGTAGYWTNGSRAQCGYE